MWRKCFRSNGSLSYLIPCRLSLSLCGFSCCSHSVLVTTLDDEGDVTSVWYPGYHSRSKRKRKQETKCDTSFYFSISLLEPTVMLLLTLILLLDSSSLKEAYVFPRDWQRDKFGNNGRKEVTEVSGSHFRLGCLLLSLQEKKLCMTVVFLSPRIELFYSFLSFLLLFFRSSSLLHHYHWRRRKKETRQHSYSSIRETPNHHHPVLSVYHEWGQRDNSKRGCV